MAYEIRTNKQGEKTGKILLINQKSKESMQINQDQSQYLPISLIQRYSYITFNVQGYSVGVFSIIMGVSSVWAWLQGMFTGGIGVIN